MLYTEFSHEKTVLIHALTKTIVFAPQWVHLFNHISAWCQWNSDNALNCKDKFSKRQSALQNLGPSMEFFEPNRLSSEQ